MFTLSARWFYICNAATDHTTCTLCYTMPSYFVTRCTCTICILCYTLPLVQETVGCYHTAPTGIAHPVTLFSKRDKARKSLLKILSFSLSLHSKEASRSFLRRSFLLLDSRAHAQVDRLPPQPPILSLLVNRSTSPSIQSSNIFIC